MPALRLKPKLKQAEFTLEFQQKTSRYEYAWVLEGDVRVAEIMFVGGSSMGRIVQVFRDAGIKVTIDEHQPIKGKKAMINAVGGSD